MSSKNLRRKVCRIYSEFSFSIYIYIFFFAFCSARARALNDFLKIQLTYTDWGTDRLQKNDKKTQDTMWQDNWDDEEIDDDFCKQLRAQLKQ